MKINENKWKAVDSNENQWNSMNINENQWNSLKINENQSKKHENPWKSIKINERIIKIDENRCKIIGNQRKSLTNEWTNQCGSKDHCKLWRRDFIRRFEVILKNDVGEVTFFSRLP